MSSLDHEKWAVFLTATANAKTLNSALLRIQGWSVSEYLRDSLWTVFTSKERPLLTPVPTTTPFGENHRNDFTGASLAEINTFMRSSTEQLLDLGVFLELWMVLDDIGLATSTCVMCKSCFDGGDEDDSTTWTYTDNFEAMRIPIDQAWHVLTSLMTGWEFIDFQTNTAVQVDGTATFDTKFSKEISDPKVLERREKGWQMWREEGHV
ncbi:hypothetical protein B0H15DRAFT_799434 [Mycena belliarum]|uniref:Uncharacterized protein n=1 Tax=Mycena belliarum TaxID=1033014 RepID=A0AAD6XWL7_9AGAR|nr:hypothetical protein B0H15DRAFT_799434 [Mycena belliae]